MHYEATARISEKKTANHEPRFAAHLAAHRAVCAALGATHGVSCGVCVAPLLRPVRGLRGGGWRSKVERLRAQPTPAPTLSSPKRIALGRSLWGQGGEPRSVAIWNHAPRLAIVAARVRASLAVRHVPDPPSRPHHATRRCRRCRELVVTRRRRQRERARRFSRSVAPHAASSSSRSRGGGASASALDVPRAVSRSSSRGVPPLAQAV